MIFAYFSNLIKLFINESAFEWSWCMYLKTIWDLELLQIKIWISSDFFRAKSHKKKKNELIDT